MLYNLGLEYMWYKGWDEFQMINMYTLCWKYTIAIPIETNGAVTSLHNESWLVVKNDV